MFYTCSLLIRYKRMEDVEALFRCKKQRETMARERRTNSDRGREREDADRRARNEFVPKVMGIQTYADARVLVMQGQGPGPDELGRHYYSRLADFLDYFGVPGGST